MIDIVISAYVHAPEGESLRSVNTRLIENALAAVDALCPNLEHFILQTGAKVRFGDLSDNGLWNIFLTIL